MIEADDDHSILRQHALREWHTNPTRYPREFRWHIEAGDFDHILKPADPATERGAA
jgi:hypothetical protein